MMEINLLRQYPKSKRPIDERGYSLTEDIRAIARKFDVEYFDGDRLIGYGGYNYNPMFWTDTVRLFRDHYQLAPDAEVLDVGCAKGFLMHDFKLLMPKLRVRGLDISPYAKSNAIEDMKQFIDIGNVAALPYPDNSFDLVVCLHVVHNLPEQECRQAIREINRVSRKNKFITMAAWRNDFEKEQLLKWAITALTCKHVDDWKQVLREEGYDGDYWWFIAESEGQK